MEMNVRQREIKIKVPVYYFFFIIFSPDSTHHPKNFWKKKVSICRRLYIFFCGLPVPLTRKAKGCHVANEAKGK